VDGEEAGGEVELYASNPVKRGLVAEPGDWVVEQFSGFIVREAGKVRVK